MVVFLWVVLRLVVFLRARVFDRKGIVVKMLLVYKKWLCKVLQGGRVKGLGLVNKMTVLDASVPKRGRKDPPHTSILILTPTHAILPPLILTPCTPTSCTSTAF